MVDTSDFDKAIKQLEKELSDSEVDKALLEAAFFVEGKAKNNIVSNDQIDVGFMLNTVYSVSRNGQSSFANTESTGTYKSSKTGRNVKRERLPKYKLDNSTPVAAVVAGAEYAIYQELDHKAFLRPAFDDNVDKITKVLQGRLGE